MSIGGVVNALFVIFHVWLGYHIHTSPGIAAGDRPLMEMLAGLYLFLFFRKEGQIERRYRQTKGLILKIMVEVI
ncbi:MAG: hypothetical protein MUO31_15435 [Thermodesulfovibrionales bacterium]|nr:hypothetical protein [Thermodesulfovibrionales bacterium]